MPTEYTAPVRNLLTYGDCSAADARAAWPNYLELGFTREHIPELIRMATDPELYTASGKSLEVWAPVHAWRTLAQLQAEEAVEPLVALSVENDDDDWISNELPTVFQRIGPKAIPGLTNSLYALAQDVPTCMGITEGLQLIGNNYPESRAACVTVLTEFLAKFREHDPELNGWIVASLTELSAVEALPVIREAFAQEYVDYSILGDLEDVEIDLGLRTTRTTPSVHPVPADRYPGLLESLDAYMGRPVKQEKQEKVGRNDPCPCGSGKKYKKCCLNNSDGSIQEEFLAMFSKQKIKIPQRKKDELLELLRKKKRDKAIRIVKTLTTAETRFIEDYVTRLEAQALSRQRSHWEE